MKRLLKVCVLLLGLSGLAQAIPFFDITTPTKAITLAPGATGTVTYTIENRINANIANMQYVPPTLTTRSGGTCGTTLAQRANCTIELTVQVPTTASKNGSILLDPLRVCGIQRNLVCSVANQANRVRLNINNMGGVSGVVTQALPSNLAEGTSASFTMTYTNGDRGEATGVSVALPSGTGLVIDSNSCGTPSAPVTLPISGSCVVTATYTPPIGTTGLQSFTTTLSYDQGADVPLETSTTVRTAVYIAVGGNFQGGNGIILTSPDGITWTQQTTGVPDADLINVIYANNQYVAVGGVGTILTSSDGVTWTERSRTFSSLYREVIYANNQYVAVGSQNGNSFGASLTSSNGISWTTHSIKDNEAFLSITYANNQYVTVGNAGTILTSPDGVTWTERVALTGNIRLNEVIYANNQYVTVGGNFQGGNGTILTSPDGITWTQQTTGVPNALLENVIFG